MFEASSFHKSDNTWPLFSVRQTFICDKRANFASRAHEALNNFVAPTSKPESHVRFRGPAA
jgi:hypothetical protein